MNRHRGWHWQGVWLVVAVAAAQAAQAADGTGASGQAECSWVTARRQIPVYAAPRRGADRVARIDFGARFRACPVSVRRGCAAGWVALQRGYACARYLRPLPDYAGPAHPGPGNEPERDAGVTHVAVLPGGAVAYRTRGDFAHRRNGFLLYRGSVLSAVRRLQRGPHTYWVTREGWYVMGDNTQPLTPRWRIGVDTSGAIPVGFVRQDAEVRSAPGGPVSGRVTAYAPLFGRWGGDGWVYLDEGGAVRDAVVARIGTVPATVRGPGKWIAVDLSHQVVTAWEDGRMVRAFLTSTGKTGNTAPGTYRIRWKRRIQTMRPQGGHLRVEDVQWVMYYIPARGFALHTAWHDDFGTPVSHGCVNLPRDDARWLFAWSAPHVEDYESEAFDTPATPGTPVVVFRSEPEKRR